MLANSTNPAARLRQQSDATLFRSAIVLAVALLAALPASAAAATPMPLSSVATSSTTVEVRGDQLPLDPDGGAYRMRGDLLGRWAVLKTAPWYSIPEAPSTVMQTGQEHFVGCIDRNHNRRCDSGDPSGELRFYYMTWMRYEPATGRLIKGNCVHPITSGTGDFARTRGVLTMHEVPAGPNNVRTTYRGEIVLNARPDEQVPLPDAREAYLTGARGNSC
ncbi:MAG TPA: hypothetical protein VE462_08200 [Propionibacteriaceae bacterium]|jgi:hypothetical protein|nr:hypothetical protein [Propionibacteriaceae bacterium]